jgi:hypothetical protein
MALELPAELPSCIGAFRLQKHLVLAVTDPGQRAGSVETVGATIRCFSKHGLH